MYDDYPSPPSTPSSTSRLRAISHLHTHSPLSSTHSHAYGQRATKASDIAHLLDPSYSPPRMPYMSQIYVDQAGEAHDPDFRLFAPAGYSPKRREFLTCESDDDADVDEDDVEDEGVSIYSPRRASFDSYRSASHHRPSSRASDPTYSRTSPESPYEEFTYTFQKTGYTSDDEPRREANKLRRRRVSLEQNDDDVEEYPVEEERDGTVEAHQPRAEWTCVNPLLYPRVLVY